MPSLLAVEREKYTSVWAVESYAKNSPGEIFLPIFLDMAQPMAGSLVLDAGCGSGKGMLALTAAGLRARGLDLTTAGLMPEAAGYDVMEACLWDDPAAWGFADWAICCDVLEHLPTAMTMLAVSNLLRVARRGVFFSISFVDDVHGAWIGQRLHQTVQPFVWWRDHLNAVGRVVEARDLLNAGAFLVGRK